MNFMLYILPLFLGLTVVTQGTLNRRISVDIGLSTAVFMNATVFFLVSGAILALAQWAPQYLPEFLKNPPFEFSKLKSWFIIPGLCGFFLVLGVPWSLQLNGASKTFILLITSQIVLSLIFDKLFFANELSISKIVGALIMIIGATMVVI